LGRFSYKAVSRAGGHMTGTIDAADRRSAVAVLADKGQFVTDLSEEVLLQEADGNEKAGVELGRLLRFGSHRATGKDILAMTSQLGTALRAGLPLLNAIEIIRDQQHKIVMKKLLDDLAMSVSSGQSLSEAMSRYERIFSPLYLSMIRVGETGGILEQTTDQLAGLLSRDEKIKTSLKNASAYPLFVLTIGLASAVVVVTWILPNILNVMSSDAPTLPLPTKILMWLSGFLRAWGWLVGLIILASLYWLVRWIRGEGRVKWDAFKLKVPVLGSVLRSIAVGRFARTLGSLTRGGVAILEALGIVRDTLGNELLGREIDEVAEKVKTGSALAGPLQASGYFPPLLVQIVSIGEQTGQLDELLLNAAETFDSEADSAIERFMAIFPAVLILLLALVIGFIIAATLLPIVFMQLSTGGF